MRCQEEILQYEGDESLEQAVQRVDALLLEALDRPWSLI